MKALKWLRPQGYSEYILENGVCILIGGGMVYDRDFHQLYLRTHQQLPDYMHNWEYTSIELSPEQKIEMVRILIEL